MPFGNPLPLIDPGEIPAGLLPHVDCFALPTGWEIRRMTARDHDLAGWAVVGGGERFLYEDGTVGARPRYRAYEDLGLTGGEDDLGHNDPRWETLRVVQERYARQMILPLERAFALARAHGAANRLARAGERVTLRRGGAAGVVTDTGTDGDSGQYVRVRLDGEDADHAYPLQQLVYTEDEAA